MSRPMPTPGAVAGTTSTADGQDWHDQAACIDDWEPFFAADQERAESRRRRYAIAKAICADCPVITQCREGALERREQHGVWGGLDEDERLALKRRSLPSRQPKPKPPPAVRTDPKIRPECGTGNGYKAHSENRELQCEACRAKKAADRRRERITGRIDRVA